MADDPARGPLNRAENANDARLRQLVQRSGVILSGQVVVVQHRPSQGNVTVTLRVETAVRGVATGTFAANFLEDAPGSFPLQPGERVVLFLHALNPAGFTSPVAGGCGIMRRTGGDSVDLRRLQLCFGPFAFQSSSPEEGPPGRRQLRASETGLHSQPMETGSMATSDLLRVIERFAREPPPSGLPVAFPIPARPIVREKDNGPPVDDSLTHAYPVH